MRFFLGDDNGQLKSVRCTKSPEKDWKVDISLLDDGGRQGKTKGIQRLAVQDDKIGVVRCDGSATLFSVEGVEHSVRVIQQWQETRFKPGDKYVGLGLIAESRVISCTNAGHLRLTYPETCDGEQTTAIPNRLCEWVLSDDSHSFAYGGDEVEVSVWDTSRALDPSRRLLPSSAVGTKRKKGKNLELFDGESWRAQNVANDFLNLRQPVHNTSLAFLPHIAGSIGSSHHIIAGTRLGSVRRYDTRAAKKPVADWNDIGRVGGVKTVRCGNFEHEAFVADHGSNLVVLDLRTGRVLYTYAGLAGAICSMTPTKSSLNPPLLASTSLDRFFRLHSTYEPRDTTKASSEKGTVLAKVWVKSAAGCVVWDGKLPAFGGMMDEQDCDHDIWVGMQNVGEENDATSVSGSEDEEDDQRNPNKKQRLQQ